MSVNTSNASTTRNTQAVPQASTATAANADDNLLAYPAFANLPPVEVRLAASLEAMREGRPVILMDDLDRENEADLIIAAEKSRPPPWPC